MTRYPGGIVRATPIVPTKASASGIWTLAEAMQAKAQGIWPSTNGDDAFAKALLHLDAADGSTAILNSAAGGSSLFAANGNAQIDTAQFKFAPSSCLFDGAGDYLSGDGSADFAFGAGDWTIDFWVRFASLAGTQALYDSRPPSTNGSYPTLYMTSSKLRYFAGAADRITGVATLSTGTWYHVAVARSGSSTKMFLNGAEDGSTYTDSNTYLNGAGRPFIGELGHSIGNPLNGWLDEFRISKGVARWTGAFTPPAGPYN